MIARALLSEYPGKQTGILDIAFIARYVIWQGKPEACCEVVDHRHRPAAVG
jgi:hypothetical protein